MTDLVTDEAVEAAARAAHEAWRMTACTGDDGVVWPAVARDALAAAAPIIAAQAAKHERERTAIAIARLIRARANATLDDRERLSGNISAGYALVFAGIWHKNALLSDDPVAAELTDLRAGIEALRDEWRMHEAANLRAASTQPENSSGLLLHTAIAGLCKAHARALDALLRERAR